MCLNPIRIKHKKFIGYKECFPDRQGFIQLARYDIIEGYTVSCGKCLECLKQRSIEWAFRIMDEASQYKENCFITLTYNNEFLPINKSVSRREMQLFLKSLRQAVKPVKIRFFGCGEYGKKRSRPHYHIIIFNWSPSDSFFWQRDKSGVDLYRSPLLEKIWKRGFSSVGKLTYDSALYCAKYMQKAQFNKPRCKPSFDLTPPFVQMSNRPGIGFNSVYNCNLRTDRIYRNGKSTKIPRYYLKVMERDGVYLDDFKAMRQKQGALVESVTDLEAKRKKYYSGFYENKTPLV